MAIEDSLFELQDEWMQVGLDAVKAHELVTAMTADAATSHDGIRVHELISDAAKFVAQYSGILSVDVAKALEDPSQSPEIRKYAAGLALGELASLITGPLELLEVYEGEFA